MILSAWWSGLILALTRSASAFRCQIFKIFLSVSGLWWNHNVPRTQMSFYRYTNTVMLCTYLLCNKLYMVTAQMFYCTYAFIIGHNSCCDVSGMNCKINQLLINIQLKHKYNILYFIKKNMSMEILRKENNLAVFSFQTCRPICVRVFCYVVGPQ